MLKLGLLGICFWREGLETAVGLDRRGGEKGVAGGKGSLSKAEMLKTETLKGRMLLRRPGSGGIRRFHGKIHLPRT